MSKKYDLIVFDWNGTLSVGLDIDSAEMAPLRPEVPALLALLDQQQYLLAIASNVPTRQLLIETKAYGIQEYFIAIYGADMGFGKPHPYMLQQILQQTGVIADQALMIGDTQLDAQFAHHAGVDCLLLADSTLDKPDGNQPVYYIEKIEDIAGYI